MAGVAVMRSDIRLAVADLTELKLRPLLMADNKTLVYLGHVERAFMQPGRERRRP